MRRTERCQRSWCLGERLHERRKWRRFQRRVQKRCQAVRLRSRRSWDGGPCFPRVGAPFGEVGMPVKVKYWASNSAWKVGKCERVDLLFWLCFPWKVTASERCSVVGKEHRERIKTNFLAIYVINSCWRIQKFIWHLTGVLW